MAELRIRKAPEALRKGLKLMAVERDTSLNQLMIDLLAATLDKRRVPK
jgi:hypothetical protein